MDTVSKIVRLVFQIVVGALGIFILLMIAVWAFRLVFPPGEVAQANALATVNQPADEPANLQVENSSVVGFDTQLDFGAFGAYHAVYDSNREMWTLGFWNENIIRVGSKNLADLKRDGGSISFVMPFDGWINNSAGELFVDGTKWDLGNYGESPSEETLIKKGQTIAVSYGPNNDSAGFQLWFTNQ